MKFVYSTDLHGNKKKYEDVFGFAIEHNVDLIHLGADLLPKGSSILKEQKQFIRGYLKVFYDRCREKGITVLAMFGNDDLVSRKKYFKDYATLLDEAVYLRDGYAFSGYPFVPDYPFGLKSNCKLDHDRWVMPEAQLGRPVDVGPDGFVPILDLEGYFKAKGTIEADLKLLKGGDKAVVAMHCPPCGLGLDVCDGNRRVGSKSIMEWIEREKPLLVLSGHIHESYECSKIWKANIGDTTVIQPGQGTFETHMVYIEINGRLVSADLVIK